MAEEVKFLNRSIFFVGWMLSPFTAWNDLFINIPISYVLASFLTSLTRINFMNSILAFYWLTNIAGIALMCLSGKNLFKDGENPILELLKLMLTAVCYSALLILIIKIGWLRPITFINFPSPSAEKAI